MKKYKNNNKCKYCKKTFYVKKPSRINSIYCSRKCYFDNRHLILYDKKCEECGKVFKTNGKIGMNKKYCSRKCSNKHLSGFENPHWKGGKIEKHCPVCNDIFSVFLNERRKSCSMKCGNILKKINNKKTNLGKTKYDTPHLMKMSIERNGKKRSKEICKNISIGTAKWCKRHSGMRYKYKKEYMRSNWEVLFAIFLDLNEIKWKYEPDRIYLSKINKTYIPDFYVPEWDTYIEVKGYMRDTALSKINAFKKEYGNIIIITKKEMKEFGLI